MSKVFLVTVKRPAIMEDGDPFPPDRVMVEAAGPASALTAYGAEFVEVKALSAGEAIKLHKEGVQHIDYSEPA